METIKKQWLVGDSESLQSYLDEHFNTYKKLTILLDSTSTLVEQLLHQLYEGFALESPKFLKVVTRASLQLTRGTIKAIDLITGALADSVITTILDETSIQYSSKEEKAKDILRSYQQFMKKLEKEEEGLSLQFTLSLLSKISAIYPLVIELRNLQHLRLADINLIKYTLNENCEVQMYYYSESLDDVENEHLNESKFYFYRYRLIRYLHMQKKSSVSLEHIFVGRQQVVHEISEQARAFQHSTQGSIKGITGNPGLGKTTLLKYIQKIHAIERQYIIYTPFFIELSTNLERLHEVKSAVQQMENKLAFDQKSKIMQLIQNTKEHTAEKYAELQQMLEHNPGLKMFVEEALTHLCEGYSLVDKLNKIREIYLDFKTIGSIKEEENKAALFRQKLLKKQTTEEDIVLLIERTVTILEQAKETGNSIIWMLDDIQWADKFTLAFLNKLIPKIIELPLFIIFTSRTSDTAVRSVSEQGLQQLKQTVPFEELEMFDEHDIYTFATNIFTNDDSYLTTLSEQMNRYLFKYEKQTIEPIFLTELFYVVIDEFEDMVSIDCQQKATIMVDIQTFEAHLALLFKKLSESRHYAMHTDAIFEERLGKIASHIESGDSYIKALEHYAFIGEPIVPDWFSFYAKETYALEVKEEHWETMLSIHQILMLLDTLYACPLYNFKHALYIDFLKDNFTKKHVHVSNKQLHYDVFTKLLSFKQRELDDVTKRILNKMTIEHGKNHYEQQDKNALVQTILEQVQLYLKVEQYEEALVVNNLLLDLVKEEVSSDYIEAMLNALIIHRTLGNYRNTNILVDKFMEEVTPKLNDIIEYDSEIIEILFDEVYEILNIQGRTNDLKIFESFWTKIANDLQDSYFTIKVKLFHTKKLIEDKQLQKAEELLNEAKELAKSVSNWEYRVNDYPNQIYTLLTQIQNIQEANLASLVENNNESVEGQITYLYALLNDMKLNKVVKEEEKFECYEMIAEKLAQYDAKKGPYTIERFSISVNLADAYYQLKDVHTAKKLAEQTYETAATNGIPEDSLQKILVNLLQYNCKLKQFEEIVSISDMLNVSQLTLIQQCVYWNVQAIKLLEVDQNRVHAVRALKNVMNQRVLDDEVAYIEIVRVYLTVKEYDLEKAMTKSEIRKLNQLALAVNDKLL